MFHLQRGNRQVEDREKVNKNNRGYRNWWRNKRLAEGQEGSAGHGKALVVEFS